MSSWYSRTNTTTNLSSNTPASDVSACNTEPQRVKYHNSLPMPTETYPVSQNDLCYNEIYTGVLGSNRWSGWAAAISIFLLACEIIHIIPPKVEAFSQFKSESRPVRRWDKTTNEAVVSLKDTEMGWILCLYKNKKQCLNLMYELNALPYEQEIWTHFLQLFPLANPSL